MPFKETINERLTVKLKPKKIDISDWQVLSVGQLEKLQPHIATSLGIGTILNKLKTKPFNEVLKHCHSETGKTYRNSFLYEMNVEIYKRLNVPL